MTSFLQRYKAWLTPLWFGLLVWPFGGWKGALIAIGIVAVIELLGLLPGRVLWRKFATKSAALLPDLSTPRRRYATWTVGFLLLLFLPLTFSTYWADLAGACCQYAILALGCDLIVGVTGLLVLGYCAFYAVGAYTFALLAQHFGVNFFLAIPCGALTAFIAGALLGLPVLRLRGDYLAIVTLGFGEITRILLNNMDSLTGGPNGIGNIPRPALFGLTFDTPYLRYYPALFLTILAVVIIHRLVNSRFGRALEAIREDEIAASACGIPIARYKVIAFAIGAAFAGVAGVVFATRMTSIFPESFNFLESVLVLCMVVMGGMGSWRGVIVGAVILTIVPEVLRPIAGNRMLLFGAMMVGLMLFRPQGLWPRKRVAEPEVTA